MFFILKTYIICNAFNFSKQLQYLVSCFFEIFILFLVIK